MHIHFGRWGEAFLEIHNRRFFQTIFHSAHSFSIRAVTRKNLPFSIGFICIFIWLYAFFLPMGDFKYENQLYNHNVGNSAVYYYVWLFAGCALALFVDGRKFVPKTFYSVITALACFVVLRFTGTGILSRSIMVLAAACIGHIFASNIYAFFMILNNSEKFYSMLLAVLIPKALMVVKPMVNHIDSVFDPASAIILVIILILAVCAFFYRYNTDEMPCSAKLKAPKKAYALMPLVFVVLALNDVIAPVSLNRITELAKNEIEQYYFLGVVIGIAVVLLLQKRFAVNICNMLNISFALLAIGFVFIIISFQDSRAGLMAASCFGSSYVIGIINIYYLAGFMTKKFQSIPFYRTGIALASFYYLAAFIVMHILENSELVSPLVMALICVCIVILFFMLTPFFIKMLYAGEWIEDCYRQDVTRCSRLEAKLRDYRLTASEIEVCRLLLEGYTLRQISGIQSKAYATINTYCTAIYRKLNISSRTELLLLLKDYMEK